MSLPKKVLAAMVQECNKNAAETLLTHDLPLLDMKPDLGGTPAHGGRREAMPRSCCAAVDGLVGWASSLVVSLISLCVTGAVAGILVPPVAVSQLSIVEGGFVENTALQAVVLEAVL